MIFFPLTSCDNLDTNPLLLPETSSRVVSSSTGSVDIIFVLLLRGKSQNENRTLWKLGTLPPGLITFYSTTKPLEKSWHVLGLGYNPGISREEIQNAAVVHFNGNMKPWLDIAMNQFRPLWTKYVDYDMEAIRLCNVAP